MATRIEIITTGEDLRQLATPWDNLWRQSEAGIFQAHPWIAAWWRECHRDHRLSIVCAWRAGILVGVLPLCVRRWHGVRVLEWAAQPYSDYCDVLLLDRDSDLLERMWAALYRHGGFDLMRLKHVRPDALVDHSVLGSQERTEVCLQVTKLWPDGAAWYKTLNKKTRNNYQRGKRILGEARMRQIGPGEPYTAEIRNLVALKRHWQANRDSPLVRSDTILLALAKALDQIGSLRIFLIEQAGVVIAGSVNAVHGDKMLALFATYDPAHERASPGILLMTDYTKWAFDHGIVEVDYLLGAEPYKFRYANQQTRLHIFVAARTLIGRVALKVYGRLHRPPDPEFDIGSAYRTEKGTTRATPPADSEDAPETDSRYHSTPTPTPPANVHHVLPGASRRRQ